MLLLLLPVVILVIKYITRNNQNARSTFLEYKDDIIFIIRFPSYMLMALCMVIFNNKKQINNLSNDLLNKIINFYLSYSQPIIKWIVFSFLVGLIPLLVAGRYDSSSNLINYLFTERKSDILIISNVIIGETAAEIISIVKIIKQHEAFTSLGILLVLFFVSTVSIVEILSSGSTIFLPKTGVVFIFIFSFTLSLFYRIRVFKLDQ